MLKNVRYIIANHLARKAVDQIESGNVIKGLKTFKRSIWIVPPSTELSEFGKRLRQTVKFHYEK